jgi:hypothetical protein
MSVVEPITTSNSTTGAGVVDSWHSLASSIEEIKTLHGGDAAAVGVEIGVTAVGAVLDTVAFAMDPLAKLISAGLGWLIEHISFLKEPLDQLAGDPAEVKKLAEELHKIAGNLRNAGKDLDSALQAQITRWQGEGYDSFKSLLDGHRTQIDDAGHSVDVAGYVVETTMALITAVRSLIRDIITTILGDIISTMLVALALAIPTFGASVVAGVAKCVATAAVQAAAMAAKLAKVVAFAGRVGKRLTDLAKLTKGSAPRPGSTHELTPVPPRPGSTTTPHDTPAPGTPHDTPPPTPHEETPTPGTPHEETPGTPHEDNEPFDTWLAADQYFNGPHQPVTNAPHDTPPPTPHAETPTPHDNTETASTHPPQPVPASPSPQSILKPQDISLLKKHEDWLKSNYAEGYAKVKFVDEWVKKNAPGSYPLVKAMADAKSSKNWAGWVGKDVVNVDKSLTDIQLQADEAWQQSDEKWRQDHPDPAARGEPGPQDPAAQQA